jgi:CHAT domain-containing protein
LGLANPLTATRPLPAAEAEVAQIATALKPLPCTVLAGQHATKANLSENLHGKSILHFATHGEFPEADAIDFHRILLAETASDDGRLNAEDLRQMDLHAVRIAVLSICNGGLYRFGPGDEPYGLIPVFIGAGAENVVSTLWPLEDEFGRVFMRRLYSDRFAERPAQALRRTASYFIEKGAQLRQWASFSLVGAGRPLG